MTYRRFGALGLLAAIALSLAACAGTATGPSPTAAAASPTPSTTSPTAQPTLPPTSRPSPSSTATATLTPPPSPTAAPTQTATPGPVIYTVARGDSLSLIASRYATTWQSLIYWNQDRYATLDPERLGYDPNRIEVGWQLVVWPGVVVDYRPPMSTPAPRPPTPRPNAASVLVSHGSRSSGMVALTFDMGGRTEPALAIMTWLRDHDVPATIFMTGDSVDSTTAGRQVASIINARPDLFDLGNHSYNHPDMTALSGTQVADELRRAEEAIAAYADQSPRPLFRPPYGAWDADVLTGAGSVSYHWTVLWDVDTIDWKPINQGGPTADQIVTKVVTKIQGGSIVLMHLGGYETLKALPRIVDGLRAHGYTLVTLNRLLGS